MSGGGGRWACDTSVAIPALEPNHEAHERCRRIVRRRRPVLAGHAVIETYAVLTRLPVPLRVSPATAWELLRRTFGDPCWIDGGDVVGLLDSLAQRGIVGGATYDGLVGAAASRGGRTLLTRDRRAEGTYRSLGVNFELVD